MDTEENLSVEANKENAYNCNLPVSLLYSISKEELIDFHMKYINRTKYFKSKLIIYYLYLLIIAILICLLSNHNYFLLMTVLILAILGVKICKLIRKMKLKISFNSKAYNDYFNETSLSFNEDYLIINRSCEETLGWNSISDIYSIENYILIRTFLMENIIIPLRAFKDQEETKFFIDTILKLTNLTLMCKYPENIKL